MVEITDKNDSGRTFTFALVAIIIALIGLAVSVYTTMHHLELKTLGSTDFACNINDQFSCDKVANSKYSEVLGQPLGVWGVGYFLALIIMLKLGWLKPANRKEAFQTYAALTLVGLLVSAILAGISFFMVGYWCPSCLGVYAVCILQGVVLFVFRDEIPKDVTLKNLFNGGSVALIGVIIAVAGFSFLRPQLVEHLSDQQASNTPPPPVMELLPNVYDIKINRSDYSGAGQDYRKGSDDAKVVIVEFADFECPACKQASEVMRDLADRFGDRVLIVFKNYPLDKACNPDMQGTMHRFACELAVTARCAGQYGKFWEYHNMAFDHQEDLKPGQAKKWAKDVGLTEAQIAECQKNPAHLAKVKDDAKLGSKLGVDSTPSIYINGRKYIGNRSEDGVSEQISKILSESI